MHHEESPCRKHQPSARFAYIGVCVDIVNLSLSCYFVGNVTFLEVSWRRQCINALSYMPCKDLSLLNKPLESIRVVTALINQQSYPLSQLFHLEKRCSVSKMSAVLHILAHKTSGSLCRRFKSQVHWQRRSREEVTLEESEIEFLLTTLTRVVIVDWTNFSARQIQSGI